MSDLFMNKELLRHVLESEIECYDRDGVALLKGMFDQNWIYLLDQGLEVNCNQPGVRSRFWDREEVGRTMFYDSQAWQGIEEDRKFIFDSPCAKLAAQLMSSSMVNFYFDAVFVRSPGSLFTTPWHQDEPYWSVEGYNTCTIWMPSKKKMR
ncbi:MAG: ectoine hydroxylase-related dioxygenase (phytanoyl-CoA dioxygenase family) [Gammaproteobacteria bacterium]|jgi:ectoine hydroxylase-related dioxygenase (phytanoyl-CoA dioxygenase family)